MLGTTPTYWAYKTVLRCIEGTNEIQTDPRFLRTVVQGSYWPTTAAQWKFWKDALFWVYEQIWGMSNLPLMYLVRVQWVEREYREAVNKERREAMRV